MTESERENRQIPKENPKKGECWIYKDSMMLSIYHIARGWISDGDMYTYTAKIQEVGGVIEITPYIL